MPGCFRLPSFSAASLEGMPRIKMSNFPRRKQQKNMVYSSHIMPMTPIFVRFSGGHHSSLCTNQIQSQEGKATELETRSVKSCKCEVSFLLDQHENTPCFLGKVQQQLKSVVFFFKRHQLQWLPLTQGPWY